MPAPPPPPPMAPGIPPSPIFKPTKGNANERGALLNSIRQGAKLKKTVTNDKSAPLIPGASNKKPLNPSSRNENAPPNMISPMKNNFGSLQMELRKQLANDNAPSNVISPSRNNFGSIQMELKRQLGNNDNASSNVLPQTKNNFGSIQMELKRQLGNNDNASSNVIPPTKNNFGSIQMELKKQLANDSRNRGPPPPAPALNRNVNPEVNVQRQPFLHKEITSNGGLHQSQSSQNTNSNLSVNVSTLHRKTKSNANLSTLEVSEDRNRYQPYKPVINHGKPNLAPKPPVLSSKPIGLTIKHSKNISRTHSLKSPRTPPPQSPEDSPMNKFGTVRHMSSIIGQSLANSSGNHSRSRPSLNGRPLAPPPSVPIQHSPSHQSSPSQPPPPPPKINTVKHPNHAPPPPPPIATIPQAPSHAPPPPPPPHKTQLIRPAIAVPPENNINPPPPPPRHSSMREASRHTKVDLEEKFKNMFQPSNKFPQPPPYKNIIKLYCKPNPPRSGFLN